MLILKTRKYAKTTSNLEIAMAARVFRTNYKPAMSANINGGK